MRQEFSLVNSIVCIYPTITGIFCDVTHEHVSVRGPMFLFTQ